MATLTVPIVVCVVGEGASGGALGIGIGDMLLMMENAWYSVISPEGCASILWPGEAAENAPRAAEALRLTADDLSEMGLVDRIVPEPLGGAHRDQDAAASVLKAAILDAIMELTAFSEADLLSRRRAKYRVIGVYNEDKTF
jgi:acetyl-CoA carboxylase carboxyl transferase subunit alpha